MRHGHTFDKLNALFEFWFPAKRVGPIGSTRFFVGTCDSFLAARFKPQWPVCCELFVDRTLPGFEPDYWQVMLLT